MSDDEYCPTWLKTKPTKGASAVENLLLYEVGYYNALRRFQRVFQRLKGDKVMKEQTRQLFCSDIEYFSAKHYLLLGRLLSNVNYDQEVVFDQCASKKVDLGMLLVDSCFSPEYKRHVISSFGSLQEKRQRYLTLMENAEFSRWIGRFDSEVSDATHTATFAELAIESALERARRYPSMVKAIYDEYVSEKGAGVEATFQMKRVLLRSNTLLDECYCAQDHGKRHSKRKNGQVLEIASNRGPYALVAMPAPVPDQVARLRLQKCAEMSCRNSWTAIRLFQAAVGHLQQATVTFANAQHRYSILWQQCFGRGYGYDAYIYTTQRWVRQTAQFAAEAHAIASCTRCAEAICRHALRIGWGRRASTIALLGYRVVGLLFFRLISALCRWWLGMVAGRVQEHDSGCKHIMLAFAQALAANSAAMTKVGATEAQAQALVVAVAVAVASLLSANEYM